MKNYRKFLIALGITFFGSWFNLIAIVSLIYTLTGSKSALGMAFAVKFLPKVLFSFGTTFIADRFSKKKIMIASELFSCFAVLGLVISTGNENMSIWIYVFYFLMNASISIFDPIRIAIIPTLFEKEEEYSKAVTELTIVRYATMFVATGIGGISLEILGARSLFILDAITFFISAIIISTMKMEHSKKQERLNISFTSSIYSMITDIKNGVDEVKRKVQIKRVIFIYGCRQFVYGIAQVVFSLLVLDKLAMSSAWLGISYTAGGVGCILAGFLLKIIKKRVSNESLNKLFNLLIYNLNALAIFIMFAAPNIGLFLIAVFMHDIVATASDIFLDTSIITLADKETVGKITSFYMTVGNLLFWLASVIYSILLSDVGYVKLGAVLALIMFGGTMFSYIMVNIKFNGCLKRDDIL